MIEKDFRLFLPGYVRCPDFDELRCLNSRVIDDNEGVAPYCIDWQERNGCPRENERFRDMRRGS